MADLATVRRFAGADPDADTTVLEMCLQAAVAWYEAAGVPPVVGLDAGTGPLYDFWVCNLAAWFYDNRGADSEQHVPQYIVQSLHQLRPLNRARTAVASSSRTAHEMRRGSR